MREIYFHEDEYCQIELLPEANWDFCASQMNAIDEFSDQHRTEACWDDMYVRSENPLPLDTLSMDKESLVTSLSDLLPSFDRIRTGYGSYSESCTQTMALGRNEHFVVFAAHDANNTITSLWLRLDVSTSEEANLAMKAFQILGKWPLILADWGWSVLFRLSDSQALDDYLAGRVTAFEEFNRKMNENGDGQWYAEAIQVRNYFVIVTCLLLSRFDQIPDLLIHAPIAMAKLPADISESLAPAELEPVARWWESLSNKEQEELLDCSQLSALDFKSLDEELGLDELGADASGDELPGYFDYLVNHEFRLVGFVDETAEKSSYRVMCSYVASLGSDYRHGKPGSVWQVSYRLLPLTLAISPQGRGDSLGQPIATTGPTRSSSASLVLWTENPLRFALGNFRQQ